MNLIYWTYFDRGYVSLPILTASSGRITAEVLLADDCDWVLMTSLVKRLGILQSRKLVDQIP